jgi:triacylglycerol lipase
LRVEKRLNYLFRRCLNADYIHSGDAADYAVKRNGNSLYLFFQWSQGKRDWKNNFDFPARSYSNGGKCWFVHRGFLKVWKSVRNEIENKVLSELADYPVKEIICVGYSHGAALAGLATEDMKFMFGDSVAVYGYGFGCPRFVWGIIPREVKMRFSGFTPIRNIPDIVTHLPPAVLGYSHGAELIKIGSPGKYTPVEAHYAESYLAETEKLDRTESCRV